MPSYHRFHSFRINQPQSENPYFRGIEFKALIGFNVTTTLKGFRVIERRMAERETLALSVEYDLGASAGEIGERTYRAEAQDICIDGLKIVTDQPLKKGAILRLNCPISNDRTRIPVFAEVAWAAQAGSRFRAGLRFLRL